MSLYRDQGVVLRSVKLGETDRIVTVLGQGSGKVRGVAKGVRKPGSRFGARLEPTSHVAFQCYRGRGDLDVITQVETLDANRALREHYGCLTHAVSMLEATDSVAQEREPNPALYRMLVGALRTLAESPSPVVSTAFFWKLLSLEGFHPMLDACARCGADGGPFPAYDLEEGGVLCAACGQGAGSVPERRTGSVPERRTGSVPERTAGSVPERRTSRRLAPETLVLVQRILGGELRGALAEPPGPTAADAERLAVSALEHHLERRLRSAALL